ncbi:MAG TPA: FAD binding domain-containing protein [Acidimicrobiia bacterium]|nr:FAD binding domain-containing protein [Acidimicrobiia bacterium]
MTYHEAESLDHAHHLVTSRGARVVAGGIEFALDVARLRHAPLVGVSRLEEIRGVADDPRTGEIRIGAATTLGEMVDSNILRRSLPILVEAARQVGNRRIRNQATIGGNLCSRLRGTYDVAPALLAVDAVVEVHPGKRIPVGDFIDGTDPNGDGVVAWISVPAPLAGTVSGYEKIKPDAAAPGVASVGMTMAVESSGVIGAARVVIAGVAAMPVRVRTAETALVGSEIESIPGRYLGEIIRSAAGDLDMAGRYRLEVAVAAAERLASRLRSVHGTGPAS